MNTLVPRKDRLEVYVINKVMRESAAMNARRLLRNVDPIDTPIRRVDVRRENRHLELTYE
jgi:hypothetical protein